jgi:hypothetical protein
MMVLFFVTNPSKKFLNVFYILVFFLTMLVHAAVGAALAMFLREWHLEDLKKLRAQQAAEISEAQNQTESEENAENIDNTDIETSEDRNELSGKIENENENENENIIDPESEPQQHNESNLTETESQITNNQFSGDNIIVTENKETELAASQDNVNVELEREASEVDDKINLPDFQVDEIIGNMLSESATDIPTDIIDLAAPPEVNDWNDSHDGHDWHDSPDLSETEFESDENNTGNNVESIADSIAENNAEGNAGNNTTDIQLQIDEYDNNTNNPHNISQTAIEILGENFDFNSLLAESKVIDLDIAKTENIAQTETDNNSATDFESIADKSEHLNNTVAAESVDNIFVGGVFECDTIQLRDAEFFTCQSQETITTFAPNLIQKTDAVATEYQQSFTESTPPIYKRKKKKTS